MRRDTSAGVLEHAPGPSPWARHGGEPRIPGFVWSAAPHCSDTAGVTVLSRGDRIVLLLDFGNYAVLLDPDTLLIWHQRASENGPTAPVDLRVFQLSGLRPLEGSLESLCRSMRQAGAPFLASVAPVVEHAIPTTVARRRIQHQFPELLRRLEELLILCYSSGVEESPPASRSNVALMIARPKEGTCRLFPQDWFNRAGLDYTFQGVTRVARDPDTGQIHGDGVRIDPFVLNRSLRKTRWLDGLLGRIRVLIQWSRRAR